MRPSNTVYLVSPLRIAAIAASLMFSGVSKSGSPCDKVITLRPDAFNSVASAVMREHRADLIGSDPDDRNIGRQIALGKEGDFGGFEAGARRAAGDLAHEEQFVDMERA